MKDSYLDTPLQAKAYRVWNLASGTLEEVHDVEFDETKGSQDDSTFKCHEEHECW